MSGAEGNMDPTATGSDSRCLKCQQVEFRGAPIVPLPSNTWKIEATFQMATYPKPVAIDSKELEAAIERFYAERVIIGSVAKYGLSKFV